MAVIPPDDSLAPTVKDVETPSRRAMAINRLATIFAAAIIAFYVHALFAPDALNWGGNHFAFVHPFLGFSLPTLMFICLVPGIRRWLLQALHRMSQGMIRQRPSFRRMTLIMTVLGVVVLFWLARERTHFIGDGYQILRNMSAYQNLDALPHTLQNSPLPGYLVTRLIRLLNLLEIQGSVVLAFQIMSILSGLGCLVVLGRISQLVGKETIDRLLVFLFVVSSGFAQMFFGHVEAYAPTLLLLLVFFWLSLEYLNGSCSVIVPALIFSLLVSSHFGMVVFAPLLVFLVYRSLRNGQVAVSAIAVAFFFFVTAGVLAFCGYTPPTVIALFAKESGKQLVPLSSVTTQWQAYTFLSLPHLVNLLNFQVFISPFAPVILVAGIVTTLRRFSDQMVVFLLLFAVMGLLYLAFINFDIGMSRDWDLMAPYGAAIVLVAAVLWIGGVKSDEVRREWMVTAIIVTGLSSLGSFALHTNEENSIARFKALFDERLWSRGALAYGYEDLGVFYRAKKDWQTAAGHFSRSAQYDSTNGRRWASLGDMQRITGDHDGAISSYEKAITFNMRAVDVHVTLGNYYAQRDSVGRAVAVWKKALDIDSTSLPAATNIGIALLKQGLDDSAALSWFQRVIRMDSTSSPAYLFAGQCAYNLGLYKETIHYWKRFLELDHGSDEAERVKQLLKTMVTKSSQIADD